MQPRTLPQFVAAMLAERASFLARHWLDRARVATPRRPAATGVAEPGAECADAEQVVRGLGDEVLASAAAAVLANASDAPSGSDGESAWAARQGQDAQPSVKVMRLGWRAGGAAFAAGYSVHHVVRDADLLLAVILADLERAFETLPPDVPASPAEVMALARRLQRGAGRYATAAVSGFVHALLVSLRERYRVLRHDLRNPLGTIRSALSLMEDESVPEEMRHGPGIRAMVARNAGSLDQLIARGLDDEAAALLLTPPQEVSLRDLVLAVRREVREPARLAGCEVVLGDVPAEVRSRVDSAAFEFTLTALLLAALTYASPGDELCVECAARGANELGVTGGSPPIVTGQTLVVRVQFARASGAAQPPEWDVHGLELAASLAADHGGVLSADPEGAASGDVATLAGAPTLYLRLPLTRGPSRGPAPAGAGSPGVTPVVQEPTSGVRGVGEAGLGQAAVPVTRAG